MAAYDILFADPGGEYYFSAGMAAAGVWTGGATGAAIGNNAPAGRATIYGFTGTGTRNTPNNQTVIAGCATYPVGATFANNNALISFLDNATSQCDLRVNTLGNVFFTRNGTQIGSTSTQALVTNAWAYVELKAVIAGGTSGSMEVRVNGVVWMTLTGVNTQQSANAYANQVRLNQVGAGNSWFKDVYIMADTGTGPYSTYLGDVTVAVEYPNGAGVNQQWTPNTGTQTAAVQDGTTHTGTWPDGDTTYISDSTAGHISDFAHQALSLTGTIYGVVHASYMRKDDAGSRAVRQVCLSGVTTEDNGSDLSLGNTYQYYFDVLETDPHTVAQWTLTGYNNATFGVKEIS